MSNSIFQPVLSVMAVAAVAVASFTAQAEDWPMWGRTPDRNMIAPSARNLPVAWNPGQFKPDSEQIDLDTTQGVKWVAKLGSQSYGNVTVAGGRVYIGTNNESPRDPKHRGDRGVLMAFDEKTGEFLWQLVVPKLGAGKVSDWEFLGICSSPAVEGDRVYLVTNRCEVICLDARGFSNGNTGPFTDEAQYMAGPGRPPIEPGPTDADIIWRFDMRDELGVFPHNITSSSVLIVGDVVYATTSNGQDWSHVNIPSPHAPTLIALDKHTGKLLAEETLGISQRIYHCNWSSPAFGKAGDREMVIFGAGDGFAYGLDPKPALNDEGEGVFREFWRFDCNPPEHKIKDGRPIRYPAADGPSEIIGTPVFYNNRVYVTVGQDPEHGDGVGALSCIDATLDGDISERGKVWRYTGISRSLSTPSIVDGMVIVADYSGKVHCLDADTGKVHWVYDTGSHIWGSTLVADGKVYIGNEDGDVTILAASRDLKELGKVNMHAPVYSTPVVANGVLYISTQTHLFAIGGQ